MEVHLPPSSSADLLHRARGGDLFALGFLIERLRLDLVHAVRSISGPISVARLEPEDVFQESVLEALGSITDLRAGDVRGFRAWFLGIVRNRVFFFHKRERVRIRPRAVTPLPISLVLFHDPHDFEESGTGGSERPAAAEREERVIVCVGGDHRLALILREMYASRWDTVAFVLRRPSDEAARQVHLRARQRFRRRLGFAL